MAAPKETGMTEIIISRQPPGTIAKEVVREWLRDYRTILDPVVATHLVHRIEAAIASDRLAVNRGSQIWKRLRALLVGSVNFVAMAGLIATAVLFSVAVIGIVGLIVFA
jgi:hypothetical protein